VRLAELAVHMDELSTAQDEAAPLDPRQDLAGEPARHRIGLHQNQRPFDRHSDAHADRLLEEDMSLALVPRTRSVLDRHERPSLLGAPSTSRRARLERRELDRGRLDRGLAVRADLPQRLERRLAVHARLLELGRANRADEEVDTDLRAADRTMQIASRESLLHRLDLELALANIFEVLRRAEEHVHERAEERRDQSEHDGHRDEPRVFDPSPRVLVDPVRDREPEDDEEEQQQVADYEPGARAEEVVDAAERAREHQRKILPIR